MKTHMLFAIALLPLAACTTATPPAPSATMASIANNQYSDMSCAELDAASRSAASDASWARRQQQETFSGQVSSQANLSIPITGSRQSASPNSSGSSQQQASIRQAMAAKGC